MAKEHICLGIFAHVDGGKTTLSETILYLTGAIRKLGRVDHGNSFLDTHSIEKSRGITVFSKEVRFNLGDKEIILIDTPGHGDFGPKMERAMQVIDYAILVISGPDGVQSHTLTLWELLKRYNIPTIIFVNKMDQPGTDRQAILKNIENHLKCSSLVDFMGASEEEFALCSEKLMDKFLRDGKLNDMAIGKEINERNLYPVYFGSALKNQGIEEFIGSIGGFMSNGTESEQEGCSQDFGARVYKISRDKQGNRLTHLRITSGALYSKTMLKGRKRKCGPEDEETASNFWNQKAEQIRLYNGDGFEMVQGASKGQICAVTGLSYTFPGQGLGVEEERIGLLPVLEPTLTYKVNIPEGADPVVVFKRLKTLEEQEPTLSVSWREAAKEIHVNVMGDLELDVIKQAMAESYDMTVSFGAQSIIYKETIMEPVVGIGHYEPLRHYSEVHLLMEPLPHGSGLVFETNCSEEMLAVNWQRLVMTHMQEKTHVGVLVGGEITDMRITLIGGRAHLKHTEGGDFRQATYRAIRQGLRKAKSVLLEPYYSFKLEVPSNCIGRALSDLQNMGAEVSETDNYRVIEGKGPVRTLKNYQREVLAYTKGTGRFFPSPGGYYPCQNQQEVLAQNQYNPEADLDNPTGSIFCRGGAAVYVPWDEVDEMAHVDLGVITDVNGDEDADKDRETEPVGRALLSSKKIDGSMKLTKYEEKELDAIFLKTYGKSKRDEALRREKISKGTRRPPADENYPKLNWVGGREGAGSSVTAAATGAAAEAMAAAAAKGSTKNFPELILIDGYNLLFAWEELKELSKVSMDGAREALIEILTNYQGYMKTDMEVIFDGYRVSGNIGTKHDYGDLKVIFTKESQTADGFIQEEVYRAGKKRNITVVTSDKAVQMSVLGDGAIRRSSREFIFEVISTGKDITEKIEKIRHKAIKPFEGKF